MRAISNRILGNAQRIPGQLLTKPAEEKAPVEVVPPGQPEPKATRAVKAKPK